MKALKIFLKVALVGIVCYALLAASYIHFYTIRFKKRGSPTETIRAHIPDGMAISEARKIMEEAGFVCQTTTNYQSGNRVKEGPAVWCHGKSYWWLFFIPVPWTWQFDLIDKDGKVGGISAYHPVL